MKKALITGVTGQDGSYLAEYLLDLGYSVIGTVRRTATDNTQNISHILDNKNLKLVTCDLTSASSVVDVITSYRPDEIYNLAAQSDVRLSFDIPEYTMMANAGGTTNLLHAIHQERRFTYDAKFYQASTSEMFGKVQQTPQSEETPFYPRSPYGVSKLAAHWMTINYRESYNMFNCTGILFNHESPRRGKNFVTRKIVNSFHKIAHGKQEFMELGNLDAKRDWGHAKDYVHAMHLMLQYEKPDDYVIASGKHHSVREFVELAGKYFGYDIKWDREGVKEFGYDDRTGHVLVRINPDFYRPAEVEMLLGNINKARIQLQWKPLYTFEKLVECMCITETGE